MVKRYNSKGNGKGWKGESKRHSLARRGIKTGQKLSPRIKAMLKKNPKLKNKTFKQLQKKGVFLKYQGDVDSDGVKNIKDCRPLNPKMHKDERVTEIKFDPSVEKDVSKSKIFLGKTKAFISKEAKLGRELASKKLRELKERKKAKKIKTLEEIEHPIINKLNKQTKRVDTIKTQIAETDDEKKEEKLFNELDVEQTQLREIEEKVTELNLENVSDSKLKTLAIRHTDDSFFSLGDNKFSKELKRRIKTKKKLESELSQLRSAKPQKGFLEDIFK